MAALITSNFTLPQEVANGIWEKAQTESVLEYRHITTGIIVHSDSKLPAAIYEKVAEPEPEAKPAKERKARMKA